MRPSLQDTLNQSNNFHNGMTELYHVTGGNQGPQFNGQVGVTFNRGRKFNVLYQGSTKKSLDGLSKELTKLTSRTTKGLNKFINNSKSERNGITLNNLSETFESLKQANRNAEETLDRIKELKNDETIKFPTGKTKAGFGLWIRRFFGNLIHSHDYFIKKAEKSVHTQMETTKKLATQFDAKIEQEIGQTQREAQDKQEEINIKQQEYNVIARDAEPYKNFGNNATRVNEMVRLNGEIAALTNEKQNLENNVRRLRNQKSDIDATLNDIRGRQAHLRA